MKKSKRYIKKQNNKPLINKKVLAKVIRESNTYLPKEVELSDGQKAKVFSEPTSDGKWQTFVQLGKEV